MTEENNSANLVPMDKLARVYRKMQADVQRLTREYETQVEELKA